MLGLPPRWGKGGGHHFRLDSFLPGDSLRTRRQGTQAGSWVQSPRALFTCGLGQVSIQPLSYLLHTRSCDSCPQFTAEGTKSRRGEIAHLKSHKSGGAMGPEAQTFTPSWLPPSSGRTLGLLLPSPTPYPRQYQTETRFMAPGTTHLLSHTETGLPLSGQRSAGGAEAQTGKITKQ